MNFYLDLRYALRTLRGSPAFTATAVLSLALGIGVNTAIFSVASPVLLRPLPYQDADRLVILWNRSPGIGVAEDWFSTAQYFDIKASHHGIQDLAIAIGANWNMTGDGEPERVGTLRVSANLLPMLGVRPALGELFGAADDQPGRRGKALLSHGTWMRRYGGAPAVLGRTLTLNGQPYDVVGVLPASFDLPREVMPTLGGAEHAEVVLPLPLAAGAASVRSGEDYNLLAKLRPGVSIDEAQAEMDTLTAGLRRAHPQIYPPHGGLTFSVVPLQDQVVGDLRRSLIVLIGAVVCVLVIACANVASLLLSRALARQAEIAVRSALGASRSRLVAQFLAESLLLSLGGGAGGLLLAFWLLSAIRALGSRSVPRLAEVVVNTDVLLFTLAVSVVSAVLFGLAPALRLSRLGSQANLVAAGRRMSGSGALWSAGQNRRRVLVAAQLALCVMLLIGAGLLIRSFRQLDNVSPGFNAADVLTLELTMTGRRYADVDRVLNTYRDLWNRLTALPGVESAGGVSMLPLSQMFAWGPIVLEDRPLPAGQSFVNVDQRTVAGDYFAVMQIPLLRGRLFNEHDTRATARVVVVDDHLAGTLWPDEDPLGKRLRRGGMDSDAAAPWLTVIGVVGRVKQYALDERDSRIALYHPHLQVPSRALNVVMRGAGAERLAAAAVAQIRAVDPDLPVYGITPMTGRVSESLARRRFAMLLLTLFAVMALVLASVGVYGVIACGVSQGARDIGIRLALGATPRQVLAMVVSQGITLTAVGIGVGVVGALVLGSVLDRLLFGIGHRDPLTFATVAVLLSAIAIIGSYVPARRAARIDPIVALRSE